jgi:hypothetical protein
MQNFWYRRFVTRVLLVGAFIASLTAEVVVILASSDHGTHHQPSFANRVLLTIFVALPLVACVRGYYATRRLRSASSALDGREVDRLLWLSRQFLAAAVCAYTAIVFAVGALH